MPNRGRRGRRPSSRISASIANTNLSGTTLVSRGSFPGSVTPPSSRSPSRSSSRIIYDGPPRSRSSNGSPPRRYPNSPRSPRGAIGNGPQASPGSRDPRSIRHMSYPTGGPRRVVRGGRYEPSRHSRSGPSLPGGGGAPSHRPFTPATVVPSVYLGQRRDGPTSTVGPWDSATQVPTRVSTRRYEPGHGQGHVRRSRSRDTNTQYIEVACGDFSCLHGSIGFRGAETVDQFLESWNRFNATMDDDTRNLRAATRALEESRGPPEIPVALLNDWIAAQHRCIRSAFARYCLYFLHADLIDLDDERLQTRR
ncbi:hypothetical protein FCULG_00012454 [Fusarium culmorum]|uniref:Uncharacterized protein n=1 Tax=Fusarium culmorum TaxID=5516 RepID=A0A2T4GY52_FUSCU|nr:hypothetical protein FCULG_00012454 [Fusarium culmorum]